MGENVKLSIYCRVSTEEQNVKQQVEYLKEYCKRNNHEIIKVVADEESGRKSLTERKKFLKLLKESKKGSFEAILIYNLDRLTRNWYDEPLIEKHFSDNWDKCKLISVSDSIDLSNASGRLMFRIKMAVQCYMPEDMFEKQIIGIERAKKQGKYKGGSKGRRWKKEKKIRDYILGK